LNRAEEAVAAYDQVIARFGESETPELQEEVARALFNKGNTFEKMRNDKEAKKIYSETLKKFRKSKILSIREILKTIKQKIKK
jgi:tetratricopeptide (TPR) repeat protein